MWIVIIRKQKYANLWEKDKEKYLHMFVDLKKKVIAVLVYSMASVVVTVTQLFCYKTKKCYFIIINIIFAIIFKN